jgi:predicted GIY-YIG superfamily endonuclease
MAGTVYLLHLSEPLAHARHYCGWTSNLDARLEAHRKGTGARLMEVCAERGIGFQLARTWTGDRHLERKLKRRHESPRLCPICRAPHEEVA